MSIRRSSLRDQIRDELLARMRDGRVQPGDGINEVQLSADLGVSRTPLREALIGLEQAGQIDSESGKGFRFKPVSADELTELAPILATLEGLALDQSDPERLPTLGRELLADATSFVDETASLQRIIDNDDEWHGRLISACTNGRLLALIESTRLAFHRYECLIVRNEAMVRRAADEHIAIATALAAGDVDAAKRALYENWINGAARVAESAGAT